MLSHFTGGSLFTMRGFQSHSHGPQLASHLQRVLTRKHGYDAMLRMRASNGLRPVDFCGAFRMTNTTDMELAGIDEDKTIVVECKHDAPLSEHTPAAFQVALLYTSCSGRRVIRVHTLSVRVVNQIADVFRATDMESVIAGMFKRAIRDHRRFTMSELRLRIKDELVQTLGAYRKHCTQPNAAQGQLILPECLKLLPCYASCLMKNTTVRGGNLVGSDVRMDAILTSISAPLGQLIRYIYPRCVQL